MKTDTEKRITIRIRRLLKNKRFMAQLDEEIPGKIDLNGADRYIQMADDFSVQDVREANLKRRGLI